VGLFPFSMLDDYLAWQASSLVDSLDIQAFLFLLSLLSSWDYF
jgi:hypothetical protein